MINYLKKHWEGLLISILLAELVGVLSSLLSGDIKGYYMELIKPPLSPPGWLFGVVWILLYLLMGIAAYLVYASDSDKESKKKALSTYALQLFVNFLWSIVFFRFKMPGLSILVIIVLVLLIIKTIQQFYEISKLAAYLLLPYLLWVLFATYLNIGIFLLNR